MPLIKCVRLDQTSSGLFRQDSLDTCMRRTIMRNSHPSHERRKGLGSLYLNLINYSQTKSHPHYLVCTALKLPPTLPRCEFICHLRCLNSRWYPCSRIECTYLLSLPVVVLYLFYQDNPATPPACRSKPRCHPWADPDPTTTSTCDALFGRAHNRYHG